MSSKLASPVHSHRRTYGSVCGGFSLNCLVQLQIGWSGQFDFIKESFGKCLFHVTGAGVVPWTEAVIRADFRPLRFNALSDEFVPPSAGFFHCCQMTQRNLVRSHHRSGKRIRSGYQSCGQQRPKTSNEFLGSFAPAVKPGKLFGAGRVCIKQDGTCGFGKAASEIGVFIETEPEERRKSDTRNSAVASPTEISPRFIHR